MTPEVEELMRGLEARIADNDRESDLLKRAALNLKAAENTAYCVFRYFEEEFPLAGDETNQINYSKVWLPPFIAKMTFFASCHQLEIHRAASTTSQFIAYCERELAMVRDFFIENGDFCYYYHSNQTYRDRIIFTGSGKDQYAPVVYNAVIPFRINSGCLKVAELLANAEYRTYLQKQLLPQAATPGNEAIPRGKWKRTKTDLAELVISLYEDQAVEVSGKSATFEYFRDLCQREWGVSLENISIMDNKMRIRKKSPTPYLENLARKFLERKDRLD
jgi:hypothetical protein